MAFVVLAPQIQWMQGGPDDAWGMAFALLAGVAVLIILGLRWLSRRPRASRADLDRPIPVIRARRPRRKHGKPF